MSKLQLRRSIPTIAIAGALIAFSATSGATAALVITGKQIKNNTVTTKDIKNGSLTTQDLSSATVSSLKGAVGPAGAPGATGATGAIGATGATGATGKNGVLGLESLTSWDDVPSTFGSGFISATCPAGKVPIAGAAFWSTSNDGVPFVIGTQAVTAYFDSLATDDEINVTAVCAIPS